MILAWIMYITWILALSGGAFYCYRHRSEDSILIESYLLIIPIVSAVIFSYVFIFNHGSNVAQFSGAMNLWSFWFNWWMPLSIGNLICSVFSCIRLIRSLFTKKLIVRKLFVTMIIILTLYHVLGHMPDA